MAAVIDISQLETMTAGDAELAIEALGIFRQSADLWGRMLDPHAEAAQWADAAHGIKGAARSVGREGAVATRAFRARDRRRRLGRSRCRWRVVWQVWRGHARTRSLRTITARVASGHKGGLLSVFLMACFDPPTGRFVSTRKAIDSAPIDVLCARTRQLADRHQVRLWVRRRDDCRDAGVDRGRSSRVCCVGA